MKNLHLRQEIIDRLIAMFQLKDRGDFLRAGVCPNCGKKDLYTLAAHPWTVKCGRLNNCGFEGKVKELFPDLFADLHQKYPESPQKPTATADAYLELHRGLNPRLLKGSYRQGSFYEPRTKKGTATVLFDIDRDKDISMERFIETLYLPDEAGERVARKQHFKGKHRGLFWSPPTQTLNPGDTVYITEACIDALSLQQNQLKAVAILSCVNYPEHSLQKFDPSRQITWVLALDGDKAGREYAVKHYRRMTKEGYRVQATDISGKDGKDWNDLHMLGKLTSKDMSEYLYRGELLVADSAINKALLIWRQKELQSFPVEFDRRTFWFAMNLDKLSKAFEQLDRNDQHDDKTEAEKRDIAARQAGTLAEIANCSVDFLYYQQNRLTDDSWYYAKIRFPHWGRSIKNTFSGAQISAGAEFKKRLISIAPGALFTGKSEQLDRLVKNQVYNIKTVDTIDFIGYSKEHEAYIFNDKAVHQGRVIDINDEDYFEIGSIAIKSLSRSPELQIGLAHKYNPDWTQLVWQAFGAKGLVTVAFWFGSLFAEQIRKAQSTYPFFELVGEPGAGKSTLIEFLWLLCGRYDWEGIDPRKATGAGLWRSIAQVSNLPVVMLEADREGESSAKAMDWDIFKTAYNGRTTRTRGVKNSGNDTMDMPFRGSLMISQNAEVNASEAILQRIVHVRLTRDGHSGTGKTAAEWLSRVDISEVSYFLIKATTKAKEILETFAHYQHGYERQLLNRPEIKTVRIAKNHAQIMALVHALALVVDLKQEQLSATLAELEKMAIAREKAIGDDHPMIAQFWETFYFLNDLLAKKRTLAEQSAHAPVADFHDDGNLATVTQASIDHTYTPGLNHSKDPQLIAVNLNEYREACGRHNQELPLMTDLKRLLKSSRSHKFVDTKCVNSAITDKAKKCWVFENPG